MSISRRTGSAFSFPTLVLLLANLSCASAMCAERSRTKALETLVVGYAGASETQIQLTQLETRQGKERYHVALVKGGRTLAQRRVIREVYERLHDGIGNIARSVPRRSPASNRCERKLVGQWSAAQHRPSRLELCVDQVGVEQRQDLQEWFDGAFSLVSR